MYLSSCRLSSWSIRYLYSAHRVGTPWLLMVKAKSVPSADMVAFSKASTYEREMDDMQLPDFNS